MSSIISDDAFAFHCGQQFNGIALLRSDRMWFDLEHRRDFLQQFFVLLIGRAGFAEIGRSIDDTLLLFLLENSYKENRRLVIECRSYERQEVKLKT